MNETLNKRHHREYSQLLREQTEERRELKQILTSNFHMLFGVTMGLALSESLSRLLGPKGIGAIYILILLALAFWLFRSHEKRERELDIKHSREKKYLAEFHQTEIESSGASPDQSDKNQKNETS